jgi:hypothetical protein
MTTTYKFTEGGHWRLVLDEIRKTHDTAKLTADQFEELAKATVFYLKGGHGIEATAKLAIEEVWPA